MSALAVGAGWVGLVWLGIFGWGDLLLRSLRIRGGVGETACLGLGVAIAFGGLCNLMQVVLPQTDTTFVALGTAAGVWRLARSDFTRPKLPDSASTRLLLAIVCLLAIGATTLYCYDFEFEITDDVPAYLVFPTKMLTGTLGYEPFSERRLLTSLGGLYFLQSLILTGAGYHWLHAIDPVFALIATICLLDGAMRVRGVRARPRLLLLLFLLLALPPTPNLTATMLPVPFFLLVYFMMTDPVRFAPTTVWRRSFCLSLSLAALIAMKSLYVVPLGVFVAVTSLLRLIGLSPMPGLSSAPADAVTAGDRSCVAHAMEVALTALLAGMFLLPWMITSWRQTGTALFPFLGNGFSTANFDPSVLPVWKLTPLSERLGLFLTKGLLDPWALLLIGLYLLRLRLAYDMGEPPDRPRLLNLAAWIVSALTMTLSVCLGGAGEANLARYAYPGVATGILLVLYEIALLLGIHGGAYVRQGWYGAVTVGACAVALNFNAASVVRYYNTGLFNLRLLYSGPDGTGPARRQLIEAIRPGGGRIGAGIRRMQAAVPPGEIILERIDFPFLMDFQRNSVFVADWPGAVGPSPGWPVRQGSRRLASYLMGQSVHYVAYAYANEALFPDRLMDRLPKDAWVLTDADRAFDFQDSLTEMMRVCPLAFDDGARVVIHLSTACVDELPSRDSSVRSIDGIGASQENPRSANQSR